MVTTGICVEQESFFGKFINLSHHGVNATLAFKCTDGIIDVNLSAMLGTNTDHSMPSTMPRETRHSKPSRRIRRKEARKTANQEEETDGVEETSVNLPDVLGTEMMETAYVKTLVK